MRLVSKKLLVFCLMAALFIPMVFATSALAADKKVGAPYKAVVDTTGGNLHAWARIAFAGKKLQTYDKMASFKDGAVIDNVQNCEGGYSIVTINGKTGYIRTRYLRNAPPAAPAPAKPGTAAPVPASAIGKAVGKVYKAQVDTTGGNLHAWGRIAFSGKKLQTYDKLAAFKDGAVIENVQNFEGGYSAITVNGKVGYIRTSYLKPAK